jgi:anti-anti-sigma factor
VTAMTNRERSARPRADGTFPGLRSVPPVGPAILSLRDGLDQAAAPALRERLLDVLRRRPDLLILDLSGTPSCDVAGLAVLIGTQRRARLLGIATRLVAPSLAVRRVLRSTGLDRSFTICPDLSGALAAEPRTSARPASAAPVLAAASSC